MTPEEQEYLEQQRIELKAVLTGQVKTSGVEARLLSQYPGPGGPAAFAAAVANHSPYRAPQFYRSSAAGDLVDIVRRVPPAALAAAAGVGSLIAAGRAISKRSQAVARKRLLKRLAIGGGVAVGVTGLTVPLALAAGRGKEKTAGIWNSVKDFGRGVRDAVSSGDVWAKPLNSAAVGSAGLVNPAFPNPNAGMKGAADSVRLFDGAHKKGGALGMLLPALLGWGTAVAVGKAVAKKQQKAATKRMIEHMAIGGGAVAGVGGLAAALTAGGRRRDKEER